MQASLHKKYCFALFIALLMLVMTVRVFAQKSKKIDKLIDEQNYPEVINSLKNTKGNESELLLKLADSYYQTKNYTCAEEIYAKYFKYAKQVEPEVYFNYGQALLSNKMYDSAKVQFEKYIQKVPSDYRAQRFLKACNKLTVWNELPVKYEVRNLKDINSSVADFCAVDYNDGIVFVSERGEDIVGSNRFIRTTNSYVSVFYSKYKKTATDSTLPTFKASKLFSSKIAGDYHTGPVSFSSDYKEIYYTKVQSLAGKRTGVITPKIYRAKSVASKWMRGAEFKLNDDKYTVAHPCLSPDGKRLYFVSNMKGAIGGMDIFYCERNGDGFDDPVNLGSSINTIGNESFPFMAENNVLYFSSDARGGYGGLDVFYSVLQDGKWTDPVNLKSPINSYADDFGIYFKKGEQAGYISSNRAGGKGSDDIYEFKVNKNVVDVRGKLVADGSSNLEGVKMAMIDDKGKIIQTTETTTDGEFLFENVLNNSYKIIKIDPAQEKLLMQQSLSILLSGNSEKNAFKKDDKGNFVFELLPTDKTVQTILPEEDVALVVRKNFTGSIVSGKNNNVPLSGVRINLATSKRAIIQSRITDEHGVFEFDNIKAIEEYHVSIDEEHPLVKPENLITVKDSKGKVIVNIQRSREEKFEFDLLPTDKTYLTMIEEEEARLRVNIRGMLVCSGKDGQRDAIVGARVLLLNEKKEIVRVTKTDAEGKFRFTHIPPELNYKMSTDENDPLFRQCNKVEILDNKGEVVFASEKGKKQQFNFPFLPYDKSTVALTEEENAALLIRKKFVGSIMSGNNNTVPLPGVKINLFSITKSIVQSRITDEHGVFEFDNIRTIEDYNVTIDNDNPLLKPEKLVVIKDTRGKIILNLQRNAEDKFEFQLLPTDKTFVTMIEEEDARLRVNIKGSLVCDDKKDKIIGAKVFLLNDKSEIVQVAKTDLEGRFKFTHIPPDMNYKMYTEENDVTLRYCKIVKILDKNGNIVFVSEKGKAGKFHFALLPYDRSTQAILEEEDANVRVNYKGKLKSGTESVSGASLYLKEKESTERIKATTDSNGNFEFNQLPTDKTYVVQVDENDPALANYKKLSIYDKEGKETYTGEKEAFNFEFLPTDKTTLAQQEEDDIALKPKVSYKGKLKDENDVNITDAKVILRNSQTGDRVATTTDKDGKFEFNKLPTDQTYVLEIDEKDPALANHKKVKVFNTSDKEVYAANKEDFKFELLPTDKTTLSIMVEEEPELRVFKKMKGKFIDGQDKPATEGTNVFLKDTKGNVLATEKTDKDGGFEFDKLPTNKTYVVQLGISDADLKSRNGFYLTDENSTTKKMGSFDKDGNFVFMLLPTDKTFLVQEKEEEATLKIIPRKKKEPTVEKPVETKQPEVKSKNVMALAPETKLFYFNVDSVNLDKNSVAVLTKFAKALSVKPYEQIEIGAHADNRASQQYNLELAKRRMESIVNILVANGIDASKIKGEYYGETKPIYNCIPCTPEQYRQNRRTEIKITYLQN